MLASRGDWARAAQTFAEAHALDPGDPFILRPYCTALRRIERFDPVPARWTESVNAARALLTLEPRSVLAHELLLDALDRLARRSEFLQAAKNYAELFPTSVGALDYLAAAYWEVGRLRDTNRVFDRIAALGLETPRSFDLLLGMRLHELGQTPASLVAAHREWARRYCPPPDRIPFANSLNTARRLRIGYIGAEFRCGPTFHFLYPMFRSHDRAAFEFFVYNNLGIEDECTAVYRTAEDRWFETRALDDDALCSLIRSHRIDVLVDLSGHFAGHRLTAMARRPAPVQAFFPNYPGTTGVDAVDYVFTDEWTCPPGFESMYSEQVYRVPSGYLAYRPPGDIEIPPQPALANGFPTFAVFQRPGKWNQRSFDLIASVLRAVPRARLLIQFRAADLDRPGSALIGRYARAFRARGVASPRLIFHGARAFRDRVQLCGQADIALDTFPYTGQTTTCESLWMGCPVVTLTGETHVSRVGCALLHQAGLDEWIASSPEEYRDLAVRAVSDLPALAALRSGMRARLRASSLLDGALKAREYEEAYRHMFEHWVDGQRLAPLS